MTNLNVGRRALFGLIPAALLGSAKESIPAPVDMRTINEVVALHNQFSESFQRYIHSLDTNETDLAQWRRVVDARKRYNAAWDRMR